MNVLIIWHSLSCHHWCQVNEVLGKGVGPVFCKIFWILKPLGSEKGQPKSRTLKYFLELIFCNKRQGSQRFLNLVQE